MRRLLLLRHAKSSWDDPRLEDRDRPLAPRGRRDSSRMGRELRDRDWLPQAVLVSPAARARETWALVVAELPKVPAPQMPEELYGGSSEALLGELRRVSPEVETLLLLGHNPGLESLAAWFAGPGSHAVARERMVKKFPTAALAVLEFEGDWASLSRSRARLTHFLRPKDQD